MKKLILTSILLFLIFNAVFAQDQKVQNLRLYDQKPLHFGFTIGLNTSDFYIRNSDNSCPWFENYA